jgi:hypothetical protein
MVMNNPQDDEAGKVYAFTSQCECHGLCHHYYFKDVLGFGVLTYTDYEGDRIYMFDNSSKIIISCNHALSGKDHPDGWERNEQGDFEMPLSGMIGICDVGAQFALAEAIVVQSEGSAWLDTKKAVEFWMNLAKAHQRLYDTGESMVENYVHAL